MNKEMSAQSAPKDSNSQAIKSPLLHAWSDPLANIKTNTACIKLADLQCDGDSKLCVCDMDKKLRIYKGTGLSMEYSVPDIPTALCVTYTESTLVTTLRLYFLLFIIIVFVSMMIVI